jgi:hypothetical protein
MSKDLFKEAIADAKAVKEAAINNAKLALEEAFTPHLKSILAAKLEQLDEVEDKMEEAEDEKMEEMKDKKEMEKENLDELDLEEILKELESLEEMGDEGDDKMEEAKDEKDDLKEMYYEDSEEEGGEEEFDLENMDMDDLKKVIEDVVEDMMASGELEGAEEEGEEEELDGELDTEEAPIDELDINELLAEIEEMENEKVPIKEYATFVSDYLSPLMGLLAAGLPIASITGLYLYEKHKEKAKDIVAKAEAGDEKAKAEIEKAKMEAEKVTSNLEETDNKEMEKTIAELRSELNEVNLLNAKLLYTNKIFKAKNLTESEKVKVLTTFDKATTVKETKLVYETLLESLNNKSKSSIKESLGSASKPMGVTQKQPIIETNEVFARMQKLAGIK